MCVIESWVVEDAKMDKSNLYGLNAVKGAWVVTMKVDNDDVWKDIKEQKYLGLSIEGMFSDRIEDMSKKDNAEEILEQIKQLFDE